jgi:hypothetical protein
VTREYGVFELNRARRKWLIETAFVQAYEEDFPSAIGLCDLKQKPQGPISAKRGLLIAGEILSSD